MKSTLALVLALLCLACGGGGGGGSSSSQGPSVSLNPSQLTFVTLAGATAGQESINATLQGSGQGSLYVDLDTNLPGVFTANFVVTSSTTGILTFSLASGYTPTPGVTNGQITLLLYSDPSGNNLIYSKNIPVSLTTFALSGTPVSLAAVEGQSATSAQLQLTPADPGDLVTVAPVSGSWLSSTRTDASSFALTADSTGLPAGTYQGGVQVTTQDSTLSVPVSLAMGSGILVAPSQTLILNASSTAASLHGSMPLSFYQDQPKAWSITCDQPWLVLGSTSGVGDTNLAFTLDSTLLAALPNDATATATLRITAAGLTATQTQVALQKTMPEVFMVHPAVLPANAASQLQLFGKGFSQLASAAGFSISGVTGITGTVVSDTQAVLQVPAMTPGHHAVATCVLPALAPVNADVVAAVPQALGYAKVSSSGSIRSALYDPTRQAVYAVNIDQDGLVRIQWNGTQWVSTMLPVATIGDLAMAPDRRQVFVTSGASTLYAVDPDTMQTAATYAAPTGTMGTSSNYTNGLQATQNDRIWFPSSESEKQLYFELDQGQFATWFGIPGSNSMLYLPRFFSSGDGSRMLMTQSGESPAPPNYLYLSTPDAAVSATNVPLVYYDANLDFDGGRALVDGADLYDTADFALLGHAQDGVSRYGLAGLLSPDGSRAYCYVFQSVNSNDIVRIDVFDTTSLDGATSNFVKLGSIPVPDLSTSCPGYPNACEESPHFFISPLGDTLFLFGNQGLIVVPIPSHLSSLDRVGALGLVRGGRTLR